MKAHKKIIETILTGIIILILRSSNFETRVRKKIYHTLFSSFATTLKSSPNTAVTSQTPPVTQTSTNTGSNNGPVQTNTANCGIAALIGIDGC